MRDCLWKLESVALVGHRRARLDSVTLTIRPGVTAVVGASGAGKTSLISLLVELERPSRGTISGSEPPASRLPLFWVPQTGGLWPHLSVRGHLQAVAPPEATDADGQSLLQQFDLSHVATSFPDALSEGERGRLAVARALATDAAILVMDEPLANVDLMRANRYWRIIQQYCEQGTSLIFATHSVETVLREADHVICLADGRLKYAGDKHLLYHQPDSRELAEILGPANWFGESQEADLWLDGARPNVRCYRPEQLVVESQRQSPLQVLDARYGNALGELEVQNDHLQARRRVFHRPAGKRFQVGDRIVLRVLTLLLAVCLFSGCGRSLSEPELPSREVRHWSMPPAGKIIPAPRSVCFGDHDEVFVLDNAGRVLVFSSAGDLQRQWEMPAYDVGKPEGLCQLADGRIAVADTHYSRVVFFDRQGTVQGMHGQYGRRPGQFIYPVAITQDDKENYYVCEYGENDRVQKFSSAGQFLLEFGSFGTSPGQFQRPSGIVWHARRVYVADAINNRIQVFSDDGQFAGILQNGETPLGLRYPYDMVKSADGDLYVVEYGAGRVTCLDLTGKILGRWGQTGAAKGQLATPWGLSVGGNRQLLIADTGNRRLVEIRQ